MAQGAAFHSRRRDASRTTGAAPSARLFPHLDVDAGTPRSLQRLAVAALLATRSDLVADNPRPATTDAARRAARACARNSTSTVYAIEHADHLVTLPSASRASGHLSKDALYIVPKDKRRAPAEPLDSRTRRRARMVGVPHEVGEILAVTPSFTAQHWSMLRVPWGSGTEASLGEGSSTRVERRHELSRWRHGLQRNACARVHRDSGGRFPPDRFRASFPSVPTDPVWFMQPQHMRPSKKQDAPVRVARRKDLPSRHALGTLQAHRRTRG